MLIGLIDMRFPRSPFRCPLRTTWLCVLPSQVSGAVLGMETVSNLDLDCCWLTEAAGQRWCDTCTLEVSMKRVSDYFGFRWLRVRELEFQSNEFITNKKPGTNEEDARKVEMEIITRRPKLSPSIKILTLVIGYLSTPRLD